MRRLCLLLAGAIVASAGQTALVQAQQDSNDPWPQYGHDERNTCNSPYRGPHAEPELLWWDELPAGVHRGAAIARFGGETYVFAVGIEAVGESEYARLYQYQARPPLTHTPGSEWDPMWASDLMRTAGEGGACDSGDPVQASNTPLVLRHPGNGNVLVVVQTTHDVRAYDRTVGGSSPIWCTPNTQIVNSCGISSPCYGLESVNGSSFLYVTGRETPTGILLRKINPTDGSVVWTFSVDVPQGGYSTATPAIGPVDFTVPSGLEGSNVAYLTTVSIPWDPGEDQYNLHGAFAGGTAAVQAGKGIFAPNILGQSVESGSFASVSVHANGDLVVGGDDAYMYGFASTPVSGEYNLRWPTCPAYGWVSATAGIAEIDAQRYVFFNTELPPLARVLSDAGPLCSPLAMSQIGEDPTSLYGIVGGSPAIDALGRAYYVTGTFCTGLAGGGIAAFGPPTSTPYGRTWTFNPSTPLRSNAEGSLAMDEYGILYLVNDTHILALRPPFGDFDGDGVVGPIDKNDDACAYLLWRYDHEAWESQFGSVYGINLLGVGDADGDGAVTNNDVTFLLSVWGGSPDGPCP